MRTTARRVSGPAHTKATMWDAPTQTRALGRALGVVPTTPAGANHATPTQHTPTRTPYRPSLATSSRGISGVGVPRGPEPDVRSPRPENGVRRESSGSGGQGANPPPPRIPWSRPARPETNTRTPSPPHTPNHTQPHPHPRTKPEPAHMPLLEVMPTTHLGSGPPQGPMATEGSAAPTDPEHGASGHAWTGASTPA